MQERRCLVCGSEKVRQLTSRIAVCDECNLAWVPHHYPPLVLKSIYQVGYFRDKHGIAYYQDAVKRFKFISRLIEPKSKVLDFGCGMGQFLTLCQAAGYQIVGYDLSSYAAKKASLMVGKRIRSGKINQAYFKPQSFDVITSFDVIEHSADLKLLLTYFSLWLKKDGWLVISTPNVRSWDARLFGKKWNSFTKIPEHLTFISPKAIQLLLKQIGFKKISVRPWGLVRSLDFVFSEKIWGQSMPIKWIRQFLKVTGLGRVYLFFPMHNMIVVARKNV